MIRRLRKQADDIHYIGDAGKYPGSWLVSLKVRRDLKSSPDGRRSASRSDKGLAGQASLHFAQR